MNKCIKKSDYPVIDSDAIKLENGTFFWGKEEPKTEDKKDKEKEKEKSKDKVKDVEEEEMPNKITLNKVNLTIKQGQMVTIVGE